MARFTGFDEVYSALYVDFDNIYTRFLEADPEAARAFGMAPYRWVRWIENHALRILYGDGVRRRILKRMCYLNPQRYQEFRYHFIRSAFQVVDCPPLTTRGKTSRPEKNPLDAKTTYHIGNRSFVVEPVFKEESPDTLGSVLLRLMKSESEKL